MTDPFVRESRRLLEEDYLPRIRHAVGSLPRDDLWWRPNEASNSVGSLIRHLAGNVRQWLVSGVGGAPDLRDREAEFDGVPVGDTDALIDGLDAAIAEAVEVLDRVSPDRLDEVVRIQGREVTVRIAIYHAVEHFAMHTGQILWITKARTARDLGLYRTGEDGHPRAAW